MHSFLLRLLSDQLSHGEIVGEVEDVSTGEKHLVRRTADLVEFCRRIVASGAHGVKSSSDRGDQQ